MGTGPDRDGRPSDRVGRKGLIAAGLLVQAVALVWIAASASFVPWLLAAIVLGLGTAMVYPTLLAVIADVADASWRGAAVGVYRLWRDLGFAVGAIIAGVLAQAAGMPVAIGAVGALTAASALIVLVRMRETLPTRRNGPASGAAASPDR